MAILDSLYPFPMNAIRGGQQVESGFAQAEQEGEEFHRVMRDRLALRKAAAGMGSSDYFTGYDGVKGAERPDYLKKLYAEGDPETAIRLEQLASEPFKIQRSVETAGAIDANKRKAHMDETIGMFNHFMGPGGGAGESMGGGGGQVVEGGPPTGDPPTGGPAMNAFGNRLSGREREFKMTPQGPQFGVKDMSPVERADRQSQMSNRDNEIVNRNAGTEMAKTKETREAQNQAHQQVVGINKEIADVQKAIQNRDIEPGEGNAKLQELKTAREEAAAELDGLVRGRPSAMERPAPTIMQAPAQRAAPPSRAAVGKPSAGLVIPGPTGGGLTYKEQGALAVKDREEKMSASNKEIVNARLGAQKINKFKKQADELFNLVTKEDIGHPALEGIPGAQNVLSLNRSNAQVKKLNEELTNMFAEPGQSQMMNTIVERQMQGAVVPGLFSDPQLNKVNATILKSNMDHLTNFPSFLEKWHQGHKGSLDGATEAWIDYTDHNPTYTYDKDARGKVKVKENPNVVPADKWLKMRAEGKVRNVGKDTYIQGPDKSWSKQ